MIEPREVENHPKPFASERWREGAECWFHGIHEAPRAKSRGWVLSIALAVVAALTVAVL